ncbi:filamin-A-like isoform X1 [Penaeus indicus]|uniref:filamin-A-like isoform X1 n=1 Tax=Penaeus indicus TaxID=29960 RepID=UPI00300C716C
MYGSGAPEYSQAGVEEDEMSATERELAEDAQWKRIQQNTFTRWANEHLKSVSKHIGNLETDLSDGLRLIALIEVLSGKRLPKHNKRPNFRSQKLENVSVALQFLERTENIRIVNIGKFGRNWKRRKGREINIQVRKKKKKMYNEEWNKRKQGIRR